LFIPCIVNYLQALSAPTNAQLYIKVITNKYVMPASTDAHTHTHTHTHIYIYIYMSKLIEIYIMPAPTNVQLYI